MLSRMALKRRTRIILIIGALLVAILGGLALWMFVFVPSPSIAAGKDLSCWQVGKCSEACSLKCPDSLQKFGCMLKCDERCAKKGCSSALEAYRVLTRCVRSNCLGACLGGPSARCNKCTRKECGNLQRACLTHRCH